MPRVDDGPADALAVVRGWMQRLSSDRAVAEEWAVEAVRRYCGHEDPPWLQRRAVFVRLQYVTVQVVLERRGVLS